MTSSQEPIREINADDSSLDSDALKRAERELTDRLHKIQKQLRRADIVATVGALATSALGLLLIAILCDHWFLPNGLSTKGRFYCATIGLAALLVIFIARLIPLLRRRITSLYAAKTLEDAQQDKYNLTINWLQLCKNDGSERQTPDDANLTNDALRLAILRGVTFQAAKQAKKMGSEGSVDYSTVIRWGIAFAILVAIFAGYAIFSPKDPFASIARVAAPFAKIERPQALHFRSVEPGDAIVYQGDFVEITADIQGVDASSKVELLYSTEDGRLENASIKMEPSPEGSLKFCAAFPDDQSGAEESVLYHIVVDRGGAFESESDSYRLEVRPKPSFRTEKILLSFPEYTGLAAQTFENQGEIRALEGTTVELIARSNTKLERAFFLPDSSETLARKMTFLDESCERASLRFDLAWKKDSSGEGSASDQEFMTYRLKSVDVQGETNRDQQDYAVSIVRDLPPNIRWEEAPEGETEVPVNGSLRLKLWAEDPDFSLRNVRFCSSFRDLNDGNAVSARPAPEPIELSIDGSNVKRSDLSKTYSGARVVSFTIKPSELGLQVGDEIEYWGEAVDSKLPSANVSSTEKRSFVVTEASSNPEQNGESKEEQQEQENEDSGQGAGTGQNEQNAGTENDPEQTPNDNTEPNESNGSESESQDGKQDNQASESTGDTGESASESSEQGDGEKGEEKQGSNSSGSSASQDQSAGDNSNEEGSTGSEQESSGTSGGSERQSDSQSEGSRQNSDDASGSDSSNAEQSPQNSETENGGSSEGSQDMKEGNAQNGTEEQKSADNPFEKILDYMKNEAGEGNEKEDGANSDEGEQEPSKDSQSQGRGNKTRTDDDSDSDSKSEDEEVEPTFNSKNDLKEPEEERNMPTRTSSEQPDESAPSYKAKSPEKIDPNMSRNQGKVDPDTNDFLGQNASPGAEESKKPRNPNANITLDPLDNSQSVAADAVDQNAQEAKGQTTPPPNGPSEVDEGQDVQNQMDEDWEQDGKPNSAGNGSNDSESASGSKSSSNNDASSLNGGKASESKEKGEQNKKANGGGDSDSASSGSGGGGSGLGDLDPGTQTLAPADAPQLQYVEKATNLVLDYLEESLQDKVDERLLDELGWTEEELREFTERWKKMRDAARDPNNKKAKDAYLRALEEETDVNLLDSQKNEQSAEYKERDKSKAIRSEREAARLQTPERLDERVRAFSRGVSGKDLDK